MTELETRASYSPMAAYFALAFILGNAQVHAQDEWKADPTLVRKYQLLVERGLSPDHAALAMRWQQTLSHQTLHRDPDNFLNQVPAPELRDEILGSIQALRASKPKQRELATLAKEFAALPKVSMADVAHFTSRFAAELHGSRTYFIPRIFNDSDFPVLLVPVFRPLDGDTLRVTQASGLAFVEIPLQPKNLTYDGNRTSAFEFILHDKNHAMTARVIQPTLENLEGLRAWDDWVKTLPNNAKKVARALEFYYFHEVGAGIPTSRTPLPLSFPWFRLQNRTDMKGFVEGIPHEEVKRLWIEATEQILFGLPPENRPKEVYFEVNPFGGRGDAPAKDRRFQELVVKILLQPGLLDLSETGYDYYNVLHSMRIDPDLPGVETLKLRYPEGQGSYLLDRLLYRQKKRSILDIFRDSLLNICGRKLGR